MSQEISNSIKYPRRKWIRQILKALCQAALSVLADIRIEGQENMPAQGPLLIVGNHFSFSYYFIHLR